MSMEPEVQIQSPAPQIAVVPYYKERDQFPADTLALLYRKLVSQGIDQVLLHNGGMTEEDFVHFASADALTSICVDLNGSYAGLAWLTNVEETDTLRKGLAAFAFFKEYWHPGITEAAGNICLSQWFNVLDFSLIYGITPAPNRAARRFCRRLGFEYSARIPGFVSFRGETVDAMVATLTKEQFNSKAFV